MNNFKAPKYAVRLGSKFLKLGDGLRVALVNKDKFSNPKLIAMFNSENWIIYFNKEWVDKANLLEVIHCGFHEVRHAYQNMQILYSEKGLKHYYYENKRRLLKWKKELKKYFTLKDYYDEYLNFDIEIDAFAFAYYMMKKLFTIEFTIPKQIISKVKKRISEIDAQMHLKQNKIY